MNLQPKSLQIRFLITSIVGILLLITIVNLFVWEHEEKLIVETALHKQRENGLMLRHEIDKCVMVDTVLAQISIQNLVRILGDNGVAQFTVVTHGLSKFMTIKKGVELSNNGLISHRDSLNFIAARAAYLLGNIPFYHVFNTVNNEMDLFLPVVIGSDKALVKVTYPMPEIVEQIQALIRKCVVLSTVVLAFGMGFILLVIFVFVKPIQNIIAHVQSTIQKDYRDRLPHCPNHEIGTLTTLCNEMIVAIQAMRNGYRQVNPITGLVGREGIHIYVDSQLAKNALVAVLFCDLKNFYIYNTVYGFDKGDEVILYTRDCLNTIAKKFISQTIFVGHEGGDDFVVVTPIECWESFSKLFITFFDRHIHQFYSELDTRNGYIESSAPSGKIQRYDLLQVSLAGVNNQVRPFCSYTELVQVAGEVKKYVKTLDGSSYAMDRRARTISNPVHLNLPNQAIQSVVRL